jgi:hypothetical protein
MERKIVQLRFVEQSSAAEVVGVGESWSWERCVEALGEGNIG